MPEASIVEFYNSSVLMSRAAIPPHESDALHDFIKSSVAADDLTKKILPTMEKALLRSPEISMNVVSDFFAAYSHAVDGDIFRRLLSSVLNGSKSSNAVVRSNAAKLFEVMAVKSTDATNLELAVGELLALPKAGKTAGAEHRVALFTMLGSLSPSSSVSPKIAQAAPLLAKETHDAAILILATALSVHIHFCLKENLLLPKDVTALVAKEMTNTKPALRRAFCSLTGNVLWRLETVDTEAALQFAQAVQEALETNLKTVSSNPLNTIGGPLEGYIAVASLLGPLSKSGKFGRHFTSSDIPSRFILLMPFYFLQSRRRVCTSQYLNPIVIGHRCQAILLAMGQGVPKAC